MKTMNLRPWLAAFVLCASTSAFAYPPNAEVHVGVHPPPMRVEHVPAPRAGYVWGHGYWGWRGGAHVWIGGGWIHARPGFTYIDARWVLVDGAWAFYPAYWEPVAPVPVVVATVPAPVVVQQPQVTYVERPQSERPQQQGAAPDGMDPNYWYYCHDPAGYFPHVQQCGGNWQQVTPTPANQ